MALGLRVSVDMDARCLGWRSPSLPPVSTINLALFRPSALASLYSLPVEKSLSLEAISFSSKGDKHDISCRKLVDLVRLVWRALPYFMGEPGHKAINIIILFGSFPVNNTII